MGNFIDDLKKKGYIDENEQEKGRIQDHAQNRAGHPQDRRWRKFSAS
jgi:hypothetical protein